MYLCVLLYKESYPSKNTGVCKKEIQPHICEKEIQPHKMLKSLCESAVVL